MLAKEQALKEEEALKLKQKQQAQQESAKASKGKAQAKSKAKKKRYGHGDEAGGDSSKQGHRKSGGATGGSHPKKKKKKKKKKKHGKKDGVGDEGSLSSVSRSKESLPEVQAPKGRMRRSASDIAAAKEANKRYTDLGDGGVPDELVGFLALDEFHYGVREY